MTQYTLKKRTIDKRDLRVGSLFSVPKIPDLPATFYVAEPLLLKDQRDTDFCYAFASSSVSEDQEGVVLDPLFQVFATSLVTGKPDQWGAELRDAAKSLCNYGSLEMADSPVSIIDPKTKIMNPETWPEMLMIRATEHQKQSFIFTDGACDHFDNIRMAMYKDPTKKQSILTGVTWCREYTLAPNGVIDNVGQRVVGGHAFKIYGWETDEAGVIRLVAQLSNSKDIGQNGIFYFGRSVINANEGYGAIVFEDLDPAFLKKHQDLGVKVDQNSIIRNILLAFNWLLKLIKK